MPEFPLLENAGIHRTVGYQTGTTKGVVVAAAGTLHTKSASWVEIVASTAYAAGFVTVNLGGGSIASNYLMDLAIGGAGSERIIIANLLTAPSHATQGGYSYQFPIFIPSGSRLSAKVQQDKGTVGADIDVSVTLSDASFLSYQPFQQVDTFGATVSGATEGINLDPGLSPINTKPATYTTISASVPYHIRWLAIGLGRDAVTTTASRRWSLDVALGAASSERIIIADIPVDYELTSDMPAPLVLAFPVSIPAGSRISARVACSDGAATARLLQVVMYGVS